MVTGDTKRIVVIRDISSNLIEEAILVLKCDPGAQTENVQPVKLQIKGRIKNESLLREAEAIINNYIKENGLHVIPERCRRKSGIFNRKNIISFIINTLLIFSVALLIFMAGRLF